MRERKGDTDEFSASNKKQASPPFLLKGTKFPCAYSLPPSRLTIVSLLGPSCTRSHGKVCVGDIRNTNKGLIGHCAAVIDARLSTFL